MAEDVGLDLLRVVHGEKRQARAGSRKLAAIADLAAGLRVERRAVEDDDALLPGGQRIDRGAVAVERDHPAFLGQRVVTVEHRLGAGIAQASGRLEAGRGARAAALLVHRRVEPCLVDRDAALAAHVGGEVEREAVGVVQRECGFAGQHLRAGLARFGQRRLEDFHAVLERLGETLLLGLQHLRDVALLLRQLGIGIAHQARAPAPACGKKGFC